MQDAPMLSLRVVDSSLAKESRIETGRMSQVSDEINHWTRIFGKKIVICDVDESNESDCFGFEDAEDCEIGDTDSVHASTFRSNFNFTFANESSHDGKKHHQKECDEQSESQQSTQDGQSIRGT